jgi:hypothetical protein
MKASFLGLTFILLLVYLERQLRHFLFFLGKSAPAPAPLPAAVASAPAAPAKGGKAVQQAPAPAVPAQPTKGGLAFLILSS